MKFNPKFAKCYDNLAERTIKAFNTYVDEVEAGSYPDNRHGYHMKSGEFDGLQQLLKGPL